MYLKNLFLLSFTSLVSFPSSTIFAFQIPSLHAWWKLLYSCLVDSPCFQLLYICFSHLSLNRMKAPLSSETSCFHRKICGMYGSKAKALLVCEAKTHSTTVRLFFKQPHGSQTPFQPTLGLWDVIIENYAMKVTSTYVRGSSKKSSSVQWSLSLCQFQMNKGMWDVIWDVAMTIKGNDKCPVTVCERSRQHCRQQCSSPMEWSYCRMVPGGLWAPVWRSLTRYLMCFVLGKKQSHRTMKRETINSCSTQV